MLRREEEGESRPDSEPSGQLAESRRRKRRLQELAYWVGLLLVTGLLALFLASSLQDRAEAEDAASDLIATISAEKTAVAESTAAAATATREAVGEP